jgi:hypothetical protein
MIMPTMTAFSHRKSFSIMQLIYISILLVILIFGSISSNGFHNNKNQFAAYIAYTKALPSSGSPTINVPNLKVELVAKGLHK